LAITNSSGNPALIISWTSATLIVLPAGFGAFCAGHTLGSNNSGINSKSDFMVSDLSLVSGLATRLAP
jgi:hypothetical protein